MRKNVGADYYGFNRDEGNGTEGVERAGEEGAPEGWTRILEEWIVPGLGEVMEFLVERRKSRLLQRLK